MLTDPEYGIVIHLRHPVWFTRLPPNSQGEYQVDVYSVSVDGTEGA